MYYRVNNAYALSPKGHGAVTVGHKTRSLLTANAFARQQHNALSKFAENRAKRMFLKDVTALNWLIATKADHSGDWHTRLNERPTLGSDPEFFLADHGKLLPAFEVLPSKEELNAFVPYFWDGFQAEFTGDASTCIMVTLYTLQKNMLAMLKAARAKRPNADFLAQDSVEISPRNYDAKYLQLGCDPSLNVYGVSGDIPEDPSRLPWRFAGGHIHFGAPWLKDHPEKVRAAAKIVRDLDKVVGVFSVGAGVPFERNKIRRRYYGLAGEFRLPPHGLEYRTLSNFWLCHPAVSHCVLELARAVFQLSPLGLLDFWYGDEDTVQQVINTYDVDYARKLMKMNEKLFIEIFSAANETFQMAACGAKKIAQTAFQVGMESVECVVANPLAIEKNWLLQEYEAAEEARYGYKPLAVRAGWRTWQEHVSNLQ